MFHTVILGFHKIVGLYNLPAKKKKFHDAFLFKLFLIFLLGAKAAATVDILSHLIPSNRKVKKGNKFTRISFEESKRSILLYVANAGQVEDILKEREVRLKKEGLTRQPIIIYQGLKSESPEAVYVCLEEIKYTFDNFLEAFDIAFKLHFALDLRYSVESDQIWLLVQKVLYEIPIPEEIDLSNKLRTILPKFNQKERQT